MGTKGVFGYILNGKKYLIHVQFDADMLWKILTKEILIIKKHYKTSKNIANAFKKIIIGTGIPTSKIIKQCEYFTELNVSTKSTSDWYCLLRKCQSSYINLLEAGYILNQTDEYGYVFIWNLDTDNVEFYTVSNRYEKEPIYITNINSLENIISVPKQTYSEIVNKIKHQYNVKINKISELKNNIEKINNIIEKAKILDSNEIQIESENILSKYKNELNFILSVNLEFIERLKDLEI